MLKNTDEEDKRIWWSINPFILFIRVLNFKGGFSPIAIVRAKTVKIKNTDEEDKRI